MTTVTTTATHSGVIPMTLGEYLRQRRKYLNLTQDELADKAKISQGYVSALERGVNKEPEEEVVIRLADALGIGHRELMRIAYPDRIFDLEKKSIRLSTGDVVEVFGEDIEVTQETLQMLAVWASALRKHRDQD